MSTPALPSFVTALEHGLYAIDTGFQRPAFDAAYLVVDAGRCAFIDTGTRLAVPRLLSALQALGLALEQVDWIIPTHVHLDHAGGVGDLLMHLPNAKVLVHPRGARHLQDPSMLWQGALAVYGEAEMQHSYGGITPVPADRLMSSHDGLQIPVGARQLTLIDTPGHARHHHCIWCPVSRSWFTGDTFGLSYREFDLNGQAWIIPTTTPVQFEPDALKASITRLLATQPDHVCLTHYGQLGDVARLGASLLEQIDEMVAQAHIVNNSAEEDRHQALRDMLARIWLRRLREHGHTADEATLLHLLAMDIELNAQGLGIWLDRT